MSVVINTNAAASIAANNLSASNSLLQRSLNRLSSGSKIVNPADDAGGLAVSMKLSATARRQGVTAGNLSNSMSFLQTQDGVLKVVGKVLDRIGELKTLASDPTKNQSDLDNYNAEFTTLQAELTSLADEKFNGIALFGSSGLTVSATADVGGSSITFGRANLLGVSGTPWNDVGMTVSDWSASDPGVDLAYAAGGSGSIVALNETTFAFHNSGAATVQTAQSITGPFRLSFDTTTNGASDYSAMSLSAGGNSIDLKALLGAGGADHHVSIIDDGTQARISIDGGAETTVASLATSGGAPLVFSANVGGLDDFHLASLSLTNTGGAGSTHTVANAASLSALNLSDVTGAVQEIATFRAENGASQSRLGFASEVLSINKANLEAANSRIVDVDVAEESTQLARYNILTQAGSAMLAQANQSSQTALRLIG